MSVNATSIGLNMKKHGLLASVLTAAALAASVGLYLFLKSPLRAELKHKLPLSSHPPGDAQD